MTDHTVEQVIANLPEVETFKPDGASLRCLVPDSEYAQWLVRTNGAIAFGGALRFFPALPARGLADVCSWNENPGTWKWAYAHRAPEIFLFAEDAFGLQFGFRPDGSVAIFWAETAEIEDLAVGLKDFVRLIESDPKETISYELFCSAREALGPISLDQHYAFRIETALGGSLSVENLVVASSIEHLRALGKIALQL